MSLENYSNNLFVLTVNGRRLTAFGESASPVTDEPIDPKSTLRRGQGGTAIRLDRPNPGRRVTIMLDPGTPDSAYMQGLFTSNTNITLTKQQIGTLEVATGTEGIITNDAQSQRGGTTISDDQFIMEFNGWNESKGGE